MYSFAKYFFCALFLFSFNTGLFAQKIKDARSYFEAEHDSLYKAISLKRLEKGQASLTPSELYSINRYERKLDSTFSELPKKEQETYFRMQHKWLDEIRQKELAQNNYIETPKNSLDYIEVISGYNVNRLRYMYASGISGLTYGMLSLALLPELDGRRAFLIPLGMGYSSFMLPTVWGKRYGAMSYTTFRMGAHGLLMAPWYGFALSGLIFGGEIVQSYYPSASAKRIAGWGFMSATAVGVSIYSFHLGKNKGWSDAHPLILRTYARIGWVTGLLMTPGLGLNFSSRNEFHRVMAGTFLAGALAGYAAGNFIHNMYPMTRGEAIVAESFSIQGALLGSYLSLSLLDGRGSSVFIIPGTMALGGILSARLTQNSLLTPDQGRAVAFSSGAANVGAILGVLMVAPSLREASIFVGSVSSVITALLLTKNFKNTNTILLTGSLRRNYNMSLNLQPSPAWFLKESAFFSGGKLNSRHLPHIAFTANF